MLLLSSSVVEELLSHAEDVSPLEACGVLAGKEEEDTLRVTAVHRVRNAHPEPETYYTLDPQEHLAVLHEIEEAGLDLAGYYHSHPRGPDGPSTMDASRSPWPGVAYVIVSLGGDGAVTSWRWDQEARRFRREDVRFE